LSSAVCVQGASAVELQRARGSFDAERVRMVNEQLKGRDIRDANTIEATPQKGGKVVQTTKDVVSSNGKVRTITYTGTNAKSQKVNNVAVFDNQ
jgi:ribosomal protein S18